MYKIFILALREYRTQVRTKGFIIGLIVLPIFMGGGLFAYELLKDKVDTTKKTIYVIDRTNQLGESVINSAKWRNENQIIDTSSGEQIKPEYEIVLSEFDSIDPNRQEIELSGKVKKKEIHAFVVIGPDVIHPKSNVEDASIRYHSENSFMDDIRHWIEWPINKKIKDIRVEDMNIDKSQSQTLFKHIDVKGMGLVSEDKSGNGEKAKAKESNQKSIFKMLSNVYNHHYTT